MTNGKQFRHDLVKNKQTVCEVLAISQFTRKGEDILPRLDRIVREDQNEFLG